MRPLESVASELQQYHLFGIECRHHIQDELRIYRYEHLRGPNTRGGTNVNPSQYRARVNIIGRPIDAKG